MSDIDIRVEGAAGRITLNRPKALNALTYEMCLAIETALDDWRSTEAVQTIVLDAAGDRAFCAGGDIAEMYRTGTAGDFAYGQRFWADEYRMNHKIYHYPKPVVSFLQGFTMGGGVGVGCHGAVRIVGESAQIAMPECGIGLVPDVGGSLILAKAPGYLGDYLGTTGARMGPADAIFAGFADKFLPETHWPQAIDALCQGTSPDNLPFEAATGGTLAARQAQIDGLFAAADTEAIEAALADAASDDFSAETLKAMRRAAPLSKACTIEILRRLRATPPSLEAALDLEYRFTARSMERGDFLEGIRAQIIDKDRNPQWQFAGSPVPTSAVEAMLAPLPDLALQLDEGKTV